MLSRKVLHQVEAIGDLLGGWRACIEPTTVTADDFDARMLV
jgi:hypothetical protein